ncbi:hypothetical protein F5878DRAFT_337244 [Lentinula raphanica]|uniref:Uncharacterized protein n=1 Tax=Lentinula raphanica TaxID=153919 RepID=A0AA38PI73_9AGAR|nr:hypothetical protein F5878DRAFT_337244 [Lentinula raphanica]
MSSNSESERKILFPETMDYDKRPPIRRTILEGHKVPYYYRLGWLFSSPSELGQFLGEVPDDESLLRHYKRNVLSRRWYELWGRPVNPRPDVMFWESPYSPIRQHGQLLVYFVMNIPTEFQFLDEQKDNFVEKAIQTLGLPEDKLKDLKWHYARD